MTIEIRPARAEDIEVIRHVLVTTWHATYDALYGRAKVDDITSRWHSPAALASQLADSHKVNLVAVVDGEVVGTASVSAGCGRAAQLDRLYVLPDRQGCGVGTALLGAAVAAVPRADRIVLEVEPENAAAIAFYRRHGFSAEGQTADCGGRGDAIPALRMVRALRSD